MGLYTQDYPLSIFISFIGVPRKFKDEILVKLAILAKLLFSSSKVSINTLFAISFVEFESDALMKMSNEEFSLDNYFFL